MSTQQDIYVAGSENRPPMLNKENYVPWSSRLSSYLFLKRFRGTTADEETHSGNCYPGYEYGVKSENRCGMVGVMVGLSGKNVGKGRDQVVQAAVSRISGCFRILESEWQIGVTTAEDWVHLARNVSQDQEKGCCLSSDQCKHRTWALGGIGGGGYSDGQTLLPSFDSDGSAECTQLLQLLIDFKSLDKEADESLAKTRTLNWKLSVSWRADVNEYAKLWNDWYKKCEECKYDKISYDKAYNDMQQKIERLQAQLGDLKGLGGTICSRWASSVFQLESGAFQKELCFCQKSRGVDWLKGNRIQQTCYTSISEMASASPIASCVAQPSTKSWCGEKSKKVRLTYPNVPNSKQMVTPSSYGICGSNENYQIDEAPEVINTFLKRYYCPSSVTPVSSLRTDNWFTEFKNQILKEYFDTIATAAATLKNGPSFTVDLTKHHTSSLTAENRISPFYMYSGLSVIPRMIVKILGSLVQKGVLLFLLGFSADSCASVVYNRRTKKIMETMNVTFDELSVMAFEQSSSKPGLQGMTSGQISSRGLDLTYARQQ
ncbi:hypothetical protein Tco_1041939 [Tanacetum coccineum]|uniref:Uncharacterized protein n=1 Tax=Tanacetum coccineum TaxID=301880 RepID=A0ABQ5GJ51_9ASTR